MPAKKRQTSKPLTEDEARQILERIAREGSDSNRIQAIRELRRLENEHDGKVSDDLEALIERK